MERSLAKSTTVKLIVPRWGMEKEFPIEQAEAILHMPHNGGWVLPEDSEFEFVNDGIEYKPAPERAEGEQEGGDPIEG